MGGTGMHIPKCKVNLSLAGIFAYHTVNTESSDGALVKLFSSPSTQVTKSIPSHACVPTYT